MVYKATFHHSYTEGLECAGFDSLLVCAAFATAVNKKTFVVKRLSSINFNAKNHT